MKNLQHYLRELVCLCHYPITISADIPTDVCGFLVKRADLHYEQLEVEPKLKDDFTILKEYEAVNEGKWRFSKNIGKDIHLESYFEEKGGTLYCLYAMFSSCNQSIYFSLRSSLPISLWINGKLVLRSRDQNHIKQASFLVDFQQGVNTVLIERERTPIHEILLDEEQKILIMYAPSRLLRKMRAIGSYDFEWQMKQLRKQAYICFLNQFMTDGTLSFILMPRCPVDFDEDILNIYGTDGRMIHTGKIKFNTVSYIQLNTRCMVVKLTLLKLCDFVAYIPCCSFSKLLTCITYETKDDFFPDFARKILTDNLMWNWGKKEMLYQRVYQLVFRHCYHLMALANGQRDIAFIGKESEIDGGKRNYVLFFPESYSERSTDALVVYFSFGTVGEMVAEEPDYVYQGGFKDCLVMGVYRKGSNNRDIIDEMEFLKDLDEVVRAYHIRRDRIYAVGVCTGALISLGLAIGHPDLFAGVCIINGTVRLDLDYPNYSVIENIGNIPVIHLSSINDNFFNLARIIDTSTYFKKIEMHLFDVFDHKMGIEELDSPLLLEKVLHCKHERFPKAVTLVVTKQAYGKSFFLLAGDKVEKEKDAKVSVLLQPLKIEIKSKNLKNVTLYIARKEMELENSIVIEYNGCLKEIYLHDYSIVTLQHTYGQQIQNKEISKNKFYLFYDRIVIPKKLLGMESVYADKCLIILAGYEKESLPRELKKVARKLQHPLKERARNYRYQLSGESGFVEDSNLVYMENVNNQTQYGRMICEKNYMEVKKDFLIYKNQIYYAPYFLFMKCEHPLYSEREILYLAHSNALKEMLNVFGEFGNCPLFDGNILLFSKGKIQKVE